MRTVATLIARGGSKRLPGKNVRDFCGLPLIAWSIIQAQCSRLIDEVWMITDDDEIADISEGYGARIVREPSHDPDYAGSGMTATRYGLQRILAETGDIDCWVGMLPTEPLRMPDQLDRLVAEYYRFGSERSVMQAIPMRETTLYEENKTRRCLQMTLYDKSYQYFTGGFGTEAGDARRWLQETDDQPADDATIDADRKLMASERRGPAVPYITLEVWQKVDTDTLAEFELGEVLMEHNILKGRGRAVYDEYACGEAQEVRKGVSWHHQDCLQNSPLWRRIRELEEQIDLICTRLGVNEQGISRLLRGVANNNSEGE